MNEPKTQRAILAFRQGRLRCGVYARYVREVMALPLLTPLPGGGALRGLFAYKGSIVPLYSWAEICGETAAAAEGICLLLQEDGGQPLAIAVTQADELFSEEGAAIPAGAALAYGSAWLRSLSTDSGVILILDISRTYQALTR